MRYIRTLLLLCAFGSVDNVSAQSLSNNGPTPQKPSDQEIVAQRLSLYDHRNWIVIADSADPAHTAHGIETVNTGQKHDAVVQRVLDGVSKAKHVRPVVHLDKELSFVDEQAAGEREVE